MARDCSSSTRKLEKRENRMERRSYLKLAGSTAVSLASVKALSGVASAGKYRTVTVPAGEQKLFEVSSGETMENMLIDCTAPNADASIVASGSDWTIRNIGFKGEMDHTASSGFPNHISAAGDGRIENVFVGNGVVGSTRKGGIGIGADHSGHIDIVRTHIAKWSDNGVYAAGMARPGSSGGHGTLTFDRCYCHDNNISSLRIASGGTKVKNTVILNTGNTPEVSTCGCVNARGVYDGYGTANDVIEFENVHIDCTEANTDGAASALVAANTTYRVRNSQIRGPVVGNVETKNVGSNPKQTPPQGVPMTAKQAAQGTGARKQNQKHGRNKKTKQSSSKKARSGNSKTAKKTQMKRKPVAKNEANVSITQLTETEHFIDLQQFQQMIRRYFQL